MTESLTPTLDEVAAHGNRGHVGWLENNHIICRDGTSLSVIAGGGTACVPQVQYCYTSPEGTHHVRDQTPGMAPHDYPGPYTHVEVLSVGDGPYPGTNVPVEEVRKYILSHGGEWVEGETPEEAEQRAAFARGLAQAADINNQLTKEN